MCSGVYICFDILILEIGILFSTFDKGLNVGLRNEKMRQKWNKKNCLKKKNKESGGAINGYKIIVNQGIEHRLKSE